MTAPQDPDAHAQRLANRTDAKWQALKQDVAQRNAAAHSEAKKKRETLDLAKRRAKAAADN